MLRKSKKSEKLSSDFHPEFGFSAFDYHTITGTTLDEIQRKAYYELQINDAGGEDKLPGADVKRRGSVKQLAARYRETFLEI